MNIQSLHLFVKHTIFLSGWRFFTVQRSESVDINYKLSLTA